MLDFNLLFHGGNIDHPTWDDIDWHLQQIKSGRGAVGLSLNHGQKSLQVQSEGEKYHLTLGEESETDWCVRTFTNCDAVPGMISLGPYEWDSRTICYDFSVVIASFTEFFETGDVSHDLLD
jgi:hypothetical protein